MSKETKPTTPAKRITYTEWLFLRKTSVIGGEALKSPTFLILVGKGLATIDGQITDAGKKALANGYQDLPKGVATPAGSTDASGARADFNGFTKDSI